MNKNNPPPAAVEDGTVPGMESITALYSGATGAEHRGTGLLTRRILLLVTIAVAGAMLSTLVYSLAIRAEDERIGRLIRISAEWRANDLSTKLSKPADSVWAIATAFSATTEEAIQVYDKNLIAQFRELGETRGYTWSPRVTASERDGFERRMRGFGHRDFSILTYDAAGGLVPAPVRDEYFPLARIWIFDGAPPPLGFDLLTLPGRAAVMATARDQGSVALSDPLFSPVTQLVTLLYVSPVYDGGKIPATMEERRASLRGFLVGALDLFNYLQRSVEDAPKILSNIYIVAQPDAASGAAPIVPFIKYSVASGRFESTSETIDPAALVGRVVPLPLNVVDRQWTALFHYSPEVIADMSTPFLWTWLAGGLCITALVMLVTDMQLRHTALAEHMAAARVEQALKEKNVELEAAIRAKDRFLASVSHELRTPLNAIIGFTGTLLMRLPGEVNKEQERQLEIVRANADHLLSLIRDLIDLAKIESGKVDLTREPIACQALVGEVAASLAPLAKAKGLSLAIDAPEREVVVMADNRALHQIILNLASNAVKYTER
ncbi:MAG TPA: CHASE domain-containing protein, partial [Bauldia sp.]|nr:CHASE domain-containing protein [Bauldia sp.]